jgi:hypothetical protein
MQKKINEWNDMIGVTGGILSPSKCWWYLVTFKYIAGQWKALSPQGHFHLWIKDERNRRVHLDQIDPSVGTNMLGVHLAPDGNTRDHVDTLRRKAESWAHNIRSSRANKEEIWTAIHRTIPFSLCYSLPAVTLTKQECRHIMAPITRTGLPLAGIVATIPTAFRVGPLDMGGLGIIDPYIHMGVSHLENFVSNTWQQTPTGALLEMALDDFTMELGLSTPWTLERLHKGLGYVKTKSWFRHMVQFCVEQSIVVDFKIDHMLKCKRFRDRTIMDMAIEYSSNTSILQSINKIRMALNIVWLSDMASADGCHIDKKWLFPSTHHTTRNGFLWPQAHHTTKKDWSVWRQWAKSLGRNQEQVLEHPLGPWQCTQSGWMSEWDSFTTVNNELLYIRDPSVAGWKRHVIQPGRRRRLPRYFLDFLLCGAPQEHPSQLLRVSYTIHPRYIEVTAESPAPQRWYIEENHHSIWGHFEVTKDTILTKIKEIIDPIFIDSSEELDLVIRDYSNGTIVTVSDGSFLSERKQAAAAWIIESNCGTQWIMGSLAVPGSEEEYSSYRSELTGLTAISLTLKLLACGCPQPQHVIIGCDGKAALKALTVHREDISANSPNADLLCLLVDIWATVDMRPYPVHVKGHQDGILTALTWLEKMNVLMDKLAQMTAAITPREHKHLYIPFMGIRSVVHNNQHIAGRLYQVLYNNITTSHIRQYYESNLLTSNITMEDVAIRSFQHARLHSTTGLNKFVSKWLSNTLPTGVILQRRQHRIFNRCPRCNEWGEDRLHIIICWDTRAQLIRRKYLCTFRQLLERLHTSPDIMEFFINSITQFFRLPHTASSLEQEESWQLEQRLIGWPNFFSGFLGTRTVSKQQEHYRILGLQNKGKQWASKVIVHNWQMIYQLWASRNEVIHQKELIHSLSGSALLDIEVEREYEAGYEDLPQNIHKWFRMSKEQLLAQSTDYKKGWLLIVRTVRESLNIADYSIFASSRALRNWVGLNK